MKSKDKIVQNALDYVAKNEWEGLRQAYMERQIAAGKSGDVAGAAEWQDKGYELEKALGKAGVR